jgi:hypothetical protein
MNFVRLFAVSYCSVLGCVFATRHLDQLRYLKLISPIEKPSRMFGLWKVPRLSSIQFNLVGFGFLAALVLVVCGSYARMASLVAVALYFLYFAQIRTLGYISRKSNLIPQFLFVLAMVPATGRALNVISPMWPILLLKILLIQIYASAAYSKLANSGFKWGGASHMAKTLVVRHMTYDIPLAFRVAKYPWICALLGSIVLIHQITFPIVLFATRLEPAYVIVALLFHLSSIFLMRVNYLIYQGPAYLIFAVIPFGQHFLTSAVR